MAPAATAPRPHPTALASTPACRLPVLSPRPALLPRSYFLQPKAAVMGHLEEALKGSDAELKKLNASRDALAKRQEGLRAELTELITSLRRT